MKDVKGKIKESGFQVHIINALNGGQSYESLSSELHRKGCNISITDLHNYHKTMKNYGASKQDKPTGEILVTEAKSVHTGDILAAIEEISKEKPIDPKLTAKMLHSVFTRQIAIVHNLQSQHLEDELVLMNNELKNLETISKVYLSTMKAEQSLYRESSYEVLPYEVEPVEPVEGIEPFPIEVKK